MILPNLDSVLQDPEIWGDPENFRPERFIDPDGKVKRPEEFIPFGMGKYDSCDCCARLDRNNQRNV